MAQELTWVKVSALYFQDFQSHLYLSTKKHVHVAKVHVHNGQA